MPTSLEKFLSVPSLSILIKYFNLNSLHAVHANGTYSTSKAKERLSKKNASEASFLSTFFCFMPYWILQYREDYPICNWEKRVCLPMQKKKMIPDLNFRPPAFIVHSDFGWCFFGTLCEKFNFCQKGRFLIFVKFNPP